MQHNPVGKPYAHESAEKHVSGNAPYVDDIKTPASTLHIAFALSKIAHGKIKKINITKTENSQGVHSVLLAKDIKNLNIGPIWHDEPLLAKDTILFYGQAVAAVAADNLENARYAASLITVDAVELKPIVTIKQALKQKSFLDKPLIIKNGDASSAINNSKHSLTGTLKIGGQEHFYLESQVSLAIPHENGELVIYSSTQNPTEVQHLVAKVTGTKQNNIEVITRRMGGGFGGKETDSSQLACICALFAIKTKRYIKARLPRIDDFLMTGKRHDYIADYQVGFDNKGCIQGVIIDFAARCGYSLDLSKAIISRTLFHADNTYYLKNTYFCGHLCKTNTASNTAFRGFGGPQGIIVIENIIENIANFLQIDAVLIRQLNYYKKSAPKNKTPYGQIIKDNIINELTQELIDNTNYRKRKSNVNEFNNKYKYIKKGLALSPVKFGISFTTTFLNQAGALVHVYKDGSIFINHGGTEMGQGLFTKIAQIVANEFGVDISYVKASATSTMKVPNTSATAASAGSDINGMAAREACMRIKKNLIKFGKQYFKTSAKTIKFYNSKVYIDKKIISFAEFINLAYINRIELFSNGFYKTPKIHYNLETAKGSPFYYYAYGVCLSEVVIDCLTGEYKLIAVDILHDAGASLNPAIDMGQIVGGFIQGVGWLCSEELKWDKTGCLLSTSAATYKIPTLGDIPEHFNATIKPNTSNHENTIYKSKAVGEPPLMLAISVWLAIKNAIISSTGNANIKLSIPASVEQVFCALNK